MKKEEIRKIEDSRLALAKYNQGFKDGMDKMREMMLELSVKEFKNICFR